MNEMTSAFGRLQEHERIGSQKFGLKAHQPSVNKEQMSPHTAASWT